VGRNSEYGSLEEVVNAHRVRLCKRETEAIAMEKLKHVFFQAEVFRTVDARLLDRQEDLARSP
jgi:hypothetical protein